MTSFDAATDGAPRRILNSIAVGIGSTLVVSIIGAFSVRLITTHLGASDFGILVLAQAFVALVWNVSDLGLSQVLQRDIARDDQDERALLSHAMGLRITLGLIVVPVAAAVGVLVYAHRSDTLKIGLVILLCSVPFSIAQEVAAAHFTARLRNAILALGSLIQQLIFVGLVFWAVESHRSILYCIGAALIGSAVSALYTTVAARREVKFFPAYDRAVWFSMLRTSSPIGLAYIIGSLYLKADTVILSFLSTVKQIGYYGVAYAIISVFLLIPVVLTRTFIPSLVKSAGDSLEGAANASLAYSAIGGTLSATGVMVCGPSIVRLIAGTHFEASVLPLRILGVGLIFIFMSNGLSSVCLARGYTNRLFRLSLIGLVVNIGLNIAAIPSLGINGAAGATLICELLTVAFMMHLVVTQVHVRPQFFRVLARPLLAGLITCGVLAPVYLHHGLSEGIGLTLIPGVLLVYFAVLTVVGGMPTEVRSAITTARHSGR
jgi:O-antigen/teichoic acid export membrane protein